MLTRVFPIMMMAAFLPGFAEDRVTVVSADPDENVLLEVSCDGPRRLEMSSDLDEWKPVVSFLPELDRFRLEAPQYTRKVTYFRLVDISADPDVFETSDQLPEIVGKRILGFSLDVSFGEDGTGTISEGLGVEKPERIFTYELIDRQPGAASVRLAVPDGSHHALTLVFASEPFEEEANASVAFSLVKRFGEFYSLAKSPFARFDGEERYEYMLWDGGGGVPPFPEIPPLDVTGGTLWLNRELTGQVMIEILDPTQGMWVEGSQTEMVSLEFHRTGPSAHSCLITRADESKILVETNLYDFREGGMGWAWELTPGATAYPCPGGGSYGCGTYLNADLTLPAGN